LRFYKNALWERMWMEVTKEELDQYLKPEEWDPLITQEMYNNCLERIKARDKYIAERKSTREETWNQLNTQ
jgi:hypothetical protein